MSAIKSKPKAKRRKVTFSLKSPDAKEVILMGDFNQWNPKIHPMKKGNGKMIPKTINHASINSALKIIILSSNRHKRSIFDNLKTTL
ncbi:MAG: hypothetical protein P8012_02425 [Desulfobacterales bacterium]